jgi:hypothetical protein
MWPTIALIFSMIAIVINTLTWAGHDLGLIAIATAVSGIAVLVSFITSKTPTAQTVKIFSALDVGLSGLALGASLADLGIALS